MANEAFEYLLGCPEVDNDLRGLLWDSKRRGFGFEDALADLQGLNSREANESVRKQLNALQDAIVGMFKAMDRAFAQVKFDPHNDVQYMVRTFLVRFDAIFTLNQDLLLERHCPDQHIAFANSRRWSGLQLPGLKPTLDKTAMREPEDEANFREQSGLQPYYKLHGSMNWTVGGGGRLLIMGGNKAVEIKQYPLLDWYYRRFQMHLAGASRLMIIGYSFSDSHINRALIEATKQGNIQIFIVDPQGVDVLNKQDPFHLEHRVQLMEALQPRIIGASRRSFLSAFSADRVEFDRLARFFEV